jgi:hypothetical protein
MTTYPVAVNQDYPTANALLVTQVSPAAYTLYVFEYADWQTGNQAPSYADGQSAINSDGTWATTLYLIAGTYTVVIRNSTTTVVIAQHLVI